MSPLFYLIHIKSPNHQLTDTLSRLRLYRMTRLTTTVHIAVQLLIYEVDLAYQPDGRLAVDANASRACDIPDRGHARVADRRIHPAQASRRNS